MNNISVVTDLQKTYSMRKTFHDYKKKDSVADTKIKNARMKAYNHYYYIKKKQNSTTQQRWADYYFKNKESIKINNNANKPKLPNTFSKQLLTVEITF